MTNFKLTFFKLFNPKYDEAQGRKRLFIKTKRFKNKKSFKFFSIINLFDFEKNIIIFRKSFIKEIAWFDIQSKQKGNFIFSSISLLGLII